MSAGTVYFVHISDTHIGPTPDFERHGHNSLACAEALIDLINGLPTRPDFVVHTGDVVYHPDPAAYRLAARTFQRLQVPIYYVTGNHDRACDIHHFLQMGPRQHLTEDRDLLTYTFAVKGHRFMVVDARGPDEIDPHGRLSECQLELLRQELQPQDGPPLTLFMHYPVLPLNSPWMDENMLVLNGMALHELARQAGPRLRGIFHGHVHQPMQTVRDGVLYVSAASAFSQFAAWPSDDDVSYDPQHPPGYSFVHLLPDQTIIHQHTFPRPEGQREHR